MISIQRASPKQAKQLTLIAFAAKAYWGYPERWMELWKPKLTFSQEYFEENESWIALGEEAPIAFYTLQEKAGSAWVENLWVSPEFIGKGVGKMLFLHAAELSRRRGFKTIQLEADPHAEGFYEKMGMHKIGERHYEVDGQLRSLPLMEMNL